ncbi:YafY family transcriptional regulator [Listeria welshimeri]|uniref:helix-turn-helix transcriptional regulator n=1 Tax=Listeria welshimeri TaxID=1643 RepID=UPI0016244769|nr:YafY family protein [Listeria welshimeri]MBC1627183.1 YafY family transcriptional regulator [Listeria welshimeri]MBC1766844.1 YafY family transcriptional regulator [Listeria welshimeri]MBC1784123.1 YafY family transcriptional regulator [Listeria welshimeri]MBC2065569.1 YafY family transcriptional regulator [Listeria welshimeri]MBF2444745.1 YafY family transcriptional regulator [Listeria welshimeri]
MKMERLIFIFITLLSKKQIVAKDIAEKFQVSVRTIYRDIDTLTLSGIPIYSERGNQGGFFISEDYKMHRTLFTDEEKHFILNITQNINLLTDKSQFELLENKINSFVLNKQKSHSYIFDFHSWNINKNYLNQLDDALHRDRIIQFDYYGKKSVSKDRKIIPSHLIFKMNHWYLLGYCLEKDTYRFFKLSRIQNLNILSDIFEKEKYPNLTPEELEKLINPPLSFQKTEVSLEFSLSVISRVFDYFEPNEVSQVNGIIYVQSKQNINTEFFDFILSFGSNIKVISPESLKNRIIQNLKQNIFQYDTM